MIDNFGKYQKSISQDWKDHIFLQKESAELLQELFSVINSKEMEIATTHLKTSIMWATAAVVDYAAKEYIND